MNKEVKRYNCGYGESGGEIWGEMHVDVFGDYVSWNDHEALLAERDGLAAARNAYASEFAPDENADPDVGSIHANIRALKAERDVLKKDAERYQWLRDEAQWFERVPQVIQWCSDGSPQEIISDDELDAAVDAAMQGEQP